MIKIYLYTKRKLITDTHIHKRNILDQKLEKQVRVNLLKLFDTI